MFGLRPFFLCATLDTYVHGAKFEGRVSNLFFLISGIVLLLALMMLKDGGFSFRTFRILEGERDKSYLEKSVRYFLVAVGFAIGGVIAYFYGD